MEDTKYKLIKDIEKLLNSYEDLAPSTIDPDLLQYLDESSLKDIISDLLTQKENTVTDNLEYLEQFKKYD
jgi:hypothetical protein